MQTQESERDCLSRGECKLCGTVYMNNTEHSNEECEKCCENEDEIRDKTRVAARKKQREQWKQKVRNDWYHTNRGGHGQDSSQTLGVK